VSIGVQVESPIFQDLPRVPAPLGTFVHTAALFRNLPLAERASALPLLKPLLEHDLDESLYKCAQDGLNSYWGGGGAAYTRTVQS
jgi:hypothetical protein